MWGAIAFSVLKLALFRWKFRSINYTKKNEVKSVYCSPPGSSVHRILEARILEWVTISFSRKDPEIESRSPALEVDVLTSEPPGKPKTMRTEH